MQPRRLALAVVVASMASTALACAPCDRVGCDEFDEPAAADSVQTGVAGIAASESDAVSNGCQTCVLSQGRLYFWASAAAIADAEAAEVLVADAPLEIVEIDEHYELGLEVGHYLVCRGGFAATYACAAFEIADGEVATANIKATFGEGELFVLSPGAGAPSPVWDVDGPDWSD
jgi:hypothetical protein